MFYIRSSVIKLINIVKPRRHDRQLVDKSSRFFSDNFIICIIDPLKYILYFKGSMICIKTLRLLISVYKLRVDNFQ